MCVGAQTKKVAVYVTGKDAGINKVLGSKLVSAIVRSEEFSAIERTESFLSELSKEQSYQRTGAVDDDELTRLGKQFGVQYICVASVAEAFDEQYLSARLIDVETAQVERTASSSGAIQSLESLVAAANSVCADLLTNLNQGKLSNSKKVAVYVVKNDAGKEIGRVLGDKLVAGFASSGRYLAIERTNSFLSQLSKEQTYQHTGAVNDTTISRLGKQFGVQYVCVADVTDVLGGKYITARLIDVETAEIVDACDGNGYINSMSSCVAMANDVASKLSHISLSSFTKRSINNNPMSYRQNYSTQSPMISNASKYGNCDLKKVYEAYIQKYYNGRDINDDEQALQYLKVQVHQAVKVISAEYGLIGIFDDATIVYIGRDAKDITKQVLNKLNLL